MSRTQVTDRRTMALALMAAPLTAGVAARADEADVKAVALALAENALLLYQLFALEHLACGFWHIQTQVLLDAASPDPGRDQTADLDSLRSAASGLRDANTAILKEIRREAGMAPLRRLQVKNVVGTIGHFTDDTSGIINYLAGAKVSEAVALHRERSVPLFESLQRDFDVAASSTAADVRALAASI
ncbi:hypothetical protein [Rhodobacter sp. SY28-1]|uniref:hypothetical protein n=1 Tax=Rhodobacter sp. SY28-1 TaxID=2562317 RepID=UPI0010C04126|nr:hypothetical protein [Rhodobacter sp. SY28-1]